ncbi:MAG TPA: anthranilate synthase component I family protein [Spirochaetota bacterium]|nr:anthranilate synthase component I family protein [Spirochaetota bacterium]
MTPLYPSLPAVRRLARRHNRIPLYRELNLSAVGLLSLLKALEDAPQVVLLESARAGGAWNRFSFIGLGARRTLCCTPPFVDEEVDGVRTRRRINLFDFLKEDLARLSSPSYPRFGSFNGGLAGYFAYDLVNETGILRKSVRRDADVPAAFLVQVDDFIVYDNRLDRSHAAVCLYVDPERPIAEQYLRAAGRLEEMERDIIARVSRTTLPYLPSRPEPISMSFREERAVFEEKVRAAKEEIAAGEAIQVVLSMRADISDRVDPYLFYLKLRSVNPSPYMFFLKQNGRYIVGSSPEIHVKVDRGTVFLKPIAGTLPRGKTARENRENRARLLGDPKERAEHLMLVDLARNDLGRIAAPGSVRVERFMEPEDYSHVIHLVSLTRCTLGPGRDAVDALRETFPAGTVSGAPKVRAMELIDSMEGHARGVYAGAVGYIGYNGCLDTCITIRTAVFDGVHRYIQAGAGIVHDSVPEREYDEIVHKLRALSISLRYARENDMEEAARVANGR